MGLLKKNKEDNTPSAASTTTKPAKKPTYNDIASTVFPSDVKFSDREETPEEKAQRMGVRANTGNLVVLTIFGAISGIILLAISIYLSHIEALNAEKIIQRESQYWISIGLSLASAIFSVIGFQQLARWWKYKSVGQFLPTLVKEHWQKEPASRALYNIMLKVIADGESNSKMLAGIFLFANLTCSVLTLWAVISALPPGTSSAVWIYTVSISGLAFISGACISLLTSADITERSIISKAQSVYEDYAMAQKGADAILGKK